MMDANLMHEELASLRARNEYLEAENKLLRDAQAGVDGALMDRFRLTGTEAKIVMLLSKGRVFSEGQITDCCLKDETHDSAVRVHILKIRRKISPHTINNVRPKRYRLEGDSLAAIREIIKGGEA